MQNVLLWVGGTVLLTTVFFVLSFTTVVLAVAAEDTWDAAAWMGTFELARQADMNICVAKTVN